MTIYRLRQPYPYSIGRIGPIVELVSLGLVLLSAAVAGLLVRLSAIPLLVVVVGAVLLAVRGTRRAHNDRLRSWGAHTILLSEQSIVSRQPGKADVTIARADVSRIVEMPDWRLQVEAEDGAVRLLVRRELEGYEEIKSRLAAWAPIEVASITDLRTRARRAWPGVALFVMAMLVLLLASEDMLARLIADVVALAGVLMSVIGILSTPQVGRRVKLAFCLALLPSVLIAIRAVQTILELASSF